MARPLGGIVARLAHRLVVGAHRRLARDADERHAGANAGPPRIGLVVDGGDDELAVDLHERESQRDGLVALAQRHALGRFDAGMRVLELAGHAVERFPECIVVGRRERDRMVLRPHRVPVDAVQLRIHVVVADRLPHEGECPLARRGRERALARRSVEGRRGIIALGQLAPDDVVGIEEGAAGAREERGERAARGGAPEPGHEAFGGRPRTTSTTMAKTTSAIITGVRHSRRPAKRSRLRSTAGPK